MREPARYFANNTANAIGLFDLCARHGVGSVVFSSTAAVYGQPGVALIGESQPAAPINPYGASKMMSERVLMDVAAATGLRYGILRYFNVAARTRVPGSARPRRTTRIWSRSPARPRLACGRPCSSTA